ncbi:MAG: sporulation protein [Lachnospiraceae bacterium]|jgi:uncharacterized spore protein YtfJ|nr:sporulation protein [Lachnospiraceae bacterium]
MADKSNFNATVDALFKGMDSFVTTKTVVGEAQKLGDVTIVPLADVSFGIGAGAFTGNGKSNDGGGLGGKIIPSAVLIIGKDGSTNLIRTGEKEDLVSRLVNMAPGIISKFTGKGKDSGEGEPLAQEVVDAAVDLAGDAAKATADAILDGEEKE